MAGADLCDITRTVDDEGWVEYHTGSGDCVRDRDTLKQLSRVPVPSAWTDVHVNIDSDCSVRAWGRDASGKKQYLRGTRYCRELDRTKCDKVAVFVEGAQRMVHDALETLSGEPAVDEVEWVCALAVACAFHHPSLTVSELLELDAAGVYDPIGADDEVTLGGTPVADARLSDAIRRHVHRLRTMESIPSTMLFAYLGKPRLRVKGMDPRDCPARDWVPLKIADVDRYLRTINTTFRSQLFTYMHANLALRAHLLSEPPPATGYFRVVAREVGVSANSLRSTYSCRPMLDEYHRDPAAWIDEHASCDQFECVCAAFSA